MITQTKPSTAPANAAHGTGNVTSTAVLPAATPSWLTAAPRTRLGALLHTEVGHHGACYWARAGAAAAAALPLGTGWALAYTAGTQMRDGAPLTFDQMMGASPIGALIVLVATVLLGVAVSFGRHLWWHHDQAPYAGVEVRWISRDSQP